MPRDRAAAPPQAQPTVGKSPARGNPGSETRRLFRIIPPAEQARSALACGRLRPLSHAPGSGQSGLKRPPAKALRALPLREARTILQHRLTTLSPKVGFSPWQPPAATAEPPSARTQAGSAPATARDAS